MTELLTAAQMRAIETAAIESGEVTGLELMERAGRGVVDAIFEEWPELAKTSQSAVVLCGPGNNGGDGFVVARVLKEWNWEVEVFLFGDPDKLPPDARVNYDRWGELGSTRALTEAVFAKNELPRDVHLVIDAIFGTGLTRGVDLPITATSPVWELGHDYKLVAVDVPSGLCSDSGRELVARDGVNVAAPADLTVTFHLPKVGHFASDGPEDSGRVVVKTIGLPRMNRGATAPLRPRPAPQGGGEIAPTLGPGAALVEQVQLVDGINGQALKKHSAHKYTHGHALILTGGPGRTGAARLAARGALRIGAGLVTLACPQQALWEVATSITAIMCQTLDGAPGLAEMLEDDERLNALCLGPGMGLGADTQHLVLAALKANRATVLDADALMRFERDPQVLFDALHENVVLTPHAGEFKRLFPDIAEKLNAPATTGPAYSKVDATREAAKRAGCTVLFKGPDTVIADQTGRCAINSSAYERAAPWLATAGAGDVLAGFITGLLARGFPAMQAAETAAWLHTECALSYGPGLIAEDLPEELPKVFRALGL